MDRQKRNVLGDMLRGFAIFLVVFGHCIQEGSGLDFSNNSLYFQDKLYQFIYSFHMPLFMLIAGFYLYSSMERVKTVKDRWKLFLSKFSLYFVPMVIWALIEVSIVFVTMIIGDFSFDSPSLVLLNLWTVFYVRLLVGLWFLWAMIICFIIVFFVHYYLKDSVIVYALIYLSLFIIPDDYNMNVYKFVMPFYIAAFYFHMYKGTIKETKLGKYAVSVYKSKPWAVVLLSFVIFIVLFLFYKPETFIYVSQYRLSRTTIVSQIVTDVYRTVIGFAGSIFFTILFKWISELLPNYKFPVLTVLSKNSLGIYILSTYVIIMIIRQHFSLACHNYLINLCEAVFVLIITAAATILISKVPFLRAFVGKRSSKNK